MSKLNVLITTLLLGASSVAIAQPRWREPAPFVVNPPTPVRDHRVDTSYGFGDDARRDGWRHRDDGRSTGGRHYRSSWVALNEPMQLRRGRDVIDVNARGTFTQLRLQTTSGVSQIDRVIIKFRDGSRQVEQVNRRLDVRSPMVEVLLDGNNRQIDSIVVTGTSQRHGAIQVFGI
ncbi:MAG: hypothetical protein JWP01_2464 [Myxococcales bacterium]|nr:hypothetical protein [Myxococcales bacterium]